MVLLTMTPAIVRALEKLESQPAPAESPEDEAKEEILDTSGEPFLLEPSIGKPISHGQVIDISKRLKAKGYSPYHLDTLLRGSKVYLPPPPPKPEPTPEYKALMARLRRDEEARAYDRMLKPPPPLETFAQRFPTSSAAYAFSSTSAFDTSEEDNLTYDDINRQITLIFNVLISIVACAAAIWMAAKWWDTPARLALSMSGSLLVGVAEVVVYNGYLRRLGEAKGREGKVREVREVVRSWVVGGEGGGEENGDAQPIAVVEKENVSAIRERKRRKEPSR